ncbi:MoxR family ATPase [Pseudomonas qingdaonensis]|nr:MoxR family ATPase [Pseudomonas qingdaonensis]
MSALTDINALHAAIAASVLGQDQVIRQILVGLLANGHVLLESLPGLAKTRTVKALARHLDARMSRIQFTPTCCPPTSPAPRCCNRSRASTMCASSPARCSAT